MKILRLFLCLVLAIFLASSTISGLCTNDGFEIHFLDVGQGDAAVVLCDGEAMLIDGGTPECSSLLYAYLSDTLALRHIDYMIATHPHDDHIGGLPGALNACSVGMVFSSVNFYESDAFASFLKYMERQGLRLTVPNPGQTLALGSATVQFLSPLNEYENVNDASIILRITYGQTSFLFAGDAESAAERDMIEAGNAQPATLLKVDHHGGATSTSQPFLEAILPQYAVISVGAENTYGHPAEETLARLADIGATIYRTDLCGHILCRSDGQSLTFATQKNAEPFAYAPEPQSTEENFYIGNRNSMKFHNANCPSANDMNEENKVPLPPARKHLRWAMRRANGVIRRKQLKIAFFNYCLRNMSNHGIIL